MRANPPSSSGGDDAAYDGELSDAGFGGQYVMVCVSQVLSDNAADATYFTATLQFTPSECGGGTLDLNDQALARGPNSGPPTSITDVVGDIATANNLPVSAQGMATVSFGPTTIPGSADPLGCRTSTSPTRRSTSSSARPRRSARP